MSATKVLLTLAVSILGVYLAFNGLINLPSDIEDADELIWVFAKRKYARGLALAGEFLGFGHPIVLTRQIAGSAPVASVQTWSDEGLKVYNDKFDGVPVRIYDPERKVNNGPAMIWIHGGGWTTKTTTDDDYVIAEMARRLDIVIVSIDYRLSPEYPFPAPFDDCVNASKYFMENSDRFKVDRKRVAIAGASAGGNLAAAVSLKFRNDKLPYQFEHQVLVVPCLQAFDFNTPSYQEYETNDFLPKYWMINFWWWYGFGDNGHNMLDISYINDHTSAEAKRSSSAKYVSHDLLHRKYIHTTYKPQAANHGDKNTWEDIKDVVLNPYFAPLMAEKLDDLPPAYILTANNDVLRDDGIMYARRLEKAGVKAELRNYERSFHAILHFYHLCGVSKTAFEDMVQYLSKQL